MNKILAFAVPLLLITACAVKVEEDNAVGEGLLPRITTFYATVEGNEPETKVYADEDMKVLWNADDRITIFNESTYNYQYQFTGDDGDNAGGFDLIPPAGFVSGNPLDNIYAVYPYASGSGNKINNSGNKITLSLPAEQHYKADSFGIGANTMIAVTNDSFLAFKNVGGYLCLRLYGDNISVSSITIQGNNHEKIAGKADISVGVGVLPSVSMKGEATEEITLVCDPAVTIGTSKENYTEFWFVLPPTTFTGGFTITVTDELGGVFQKTTSKPLTISRSTVEWMSALNVVPNYDNVLVSFADANFKAYCVTNFDTDGDGEISMEEARVVESITVNPETITSLKGIEYFTNLERLNCSLYWRLISDEKRGLLTTLDLSNNTSLKSLNCSGNQLSSLNVSGCTELTVLDCKYNELTSINVSGLKALNLLVCVKNQLTSLDVSNCTALASLSCGNNQLSTLDVSYCSALESLTCNYNQLTTLDIGNCTALTHLQCEYNQLTTLDVSGCTALTKLYCDNNQLTSLDVSDCTALTQLYCTYNQISTLDVSDCTALTNLCCDNNQLTSLDVSDCTALDFLQCCYNQLTSLDIRNYTSLFSLYCHHNQLSILDVSGCTALSKIVCDNNQLTSLDISNCTALTSLQCPYNQLSNLDVSGCTVLESLDCQDNHLTSLDVSNNTVLDQLNCIKNPLEEIWLNADQSISVFIYPSGTVLKYL